MHVDLVESLRCPNQHEDGWLIASIDVVVDRRILKGLIGCPMCGAEWPIVDGELLFSGDSSPESDVQSYAEFAEGDSASAALRIAALLNLRGNHGAVVLMGAAARAADAISSLTGVLVLAVNAPRGVAVNHSRLRTSRMTRMSDTLHMSDTSDTSRTSPTSHAPHALPLGVGTVRGVHIDAAHSASSWVASAIRAVEKGGRLVVPANVPVPADVRELARDEHEWVGEVSVAASGLVPLRRGVVPPAL